MSKKEKTIIVPFSTGELSYGLPKLDKDKILEMQKIFNEAKNKLKQVFRNEIVRLDVFIKQEYSVIPSEDDFIKWFEDNKLYKKWENLPKISDDEIFHLAQNYLEECKNKVKDLKSQKSKSKFQNIILENATYSLENLVKDFAYEVFAPKTLKEDITNVFSFPLKQPKGALYLHINNKEFVYLLEKLKDENIVITTDLFEVMNNLECFISSRGTILKRNNLDQAKSQLKNKPLDPKKIEVIESIIKNIKIQ